VTPGLVAAGRRGPQGRPAREPQLHRLRPRERDRLPHLHGGGTRPVRRPVPLLPARPHAKAAARGAPGLAQGRVPRHLSAVFHDKLSLMYHLAYGRRTATLALLAYAMLIVSLDQYIVVVALPEIGQDLGFSEQTLQAVISPYAVASAGFLMLGGRAADVLGRRRILVTGLALYASASLAGGLAPAPGFLLIARATQGFGGALVFPATLSLVNTTFAEGRERNRASRSGACGRGRTRGRRPARRRAHAGARLGSSVLRQRAAGRRRGAAGVLANPRRPRP
jgi:hypothetical protein